LTEGRAKFQKQRRPSLRGADDHLSRHAVKRGNPPLPTAHALREWRVAHGLSCAALAWLVETSDASISRIERYQQIPRPPMIRRLIEISDGELDVAAFFP
jgi:ribosome-binding protein aMBF1 (putative translation factor)